jgi:hypothetical protein
MCSRASLTDFTAYPYLRQPGYGVLPYERLRLTGRNRALYLLPSRAMTTPCPG